MKQWLRKVCEKSIIYFPAILVTDFWQCLLQCKFILLFFYSKIQLFYCMEFMVSVWSKNYLIITFKNAINTCTAPGLTHHTSEAPPFSRVYNWEKKKTQCYSELISFVFKTLWEAWNHSMKLSSMFKGSVYQYETITEILFLAWKPQDSSNVEVSILLQ